MGLIGHATNPVSERLIGAAIEVHRHLGPGLLESSYQACLRRELEIQGISYHSQVALPLSSGLLINFNVDTLFHGIKRILR